MTDIDIARDRAYLQQAIRDLQGSGDQADARIAELRRQESVVADVLPLPGSGTRVPLHLDTQHLANLHEAWDYGADPEVIVARVRDLFDGQDGTLLRISRSLASRR